MRGKDDHTTTVSHPVKRRTNGGFLPLVLGVSAVSGSLILGMSTNGPYPRLQTASSAPVTAYETQPDARAVMAVTLPVYANPEMAAATPSGIAAQGALDQAMTAPGADSALVPEIALAPVPVTEHAAPGEMAPMVAGAPAPLTAQPVLLVGAAFDMPEALAPVSTYSFDPFGRPSADLALAPFAEPAAPAQPRIAATEMTEESLDLQRAARIDVQRRLALAGFDPRGFDGAFGPNTRSAIADFQTAWGFPATGFLEDAVYAELNRRTEDAYVAMRQRAAKTPNAAPVLASAEPEVQPGADDGKCARRSDGRIVERQSLGCDMKGFAEQFVTRGRTSIGSDDEPVEATAAAAPIFKPGVER